MDNASQRVRAAQRLLELELQGIDPNAAADLSVGDAVRQAAMGQLPGDGDPTRRVPAEAAWNRSWNSSRSTERTGDVAPLLRAEGTPLVEVVADDLELQLREALGVGFDGDAVIGVDADTLKSVQERIGALASAQSGLVTGEAIRVLARRYGIDPNLPAENLAELLAGDLAEQNMSLYPDAPPAAPPSRTERRSDPTQRISENPFPERPSSLEGAPAADELFVPMEVPQEYLIPRFEYDQLGRLKEDADGNPVPRLSAEGRPTFETIRTRKILPHRVVDGKSGAADAGEFTTIGRRRDGSDGNRSAEEVSFVLDRGDGTYQLSEPDGTGYKSSVIDEGQLGRYLIDMGYDRIAGPKLGFTATAPTLGDAESLGRMLFDRLQPGNATPGAVAEVVRQIDALGQVADGALADRALAAAGFRRQGAELETGRQLLERAREIAEAEPQAPRPARAALPAPQPTSPVMDVTPPTAFPSRGAGVEDVVGAPVRRARDMSRGQTLMTPADRQAQEVAAAGVSGPGASFVDSVSGSVDSLSFLGPGGRPITATANPAESISLAAGSLAPEGTFRPGILSGLSEARGGSGPGGSVFSTGPSLAGTESIDTGTLPSTIPVTMASSVAMPDRVDLFQLSDTATPATPLLNFEATPGSWADQASSGSLDVGGVDMVRAIDPADADVSRQQFVELSNRQAAVKTILQQFPGWESTDDLGEIFRRMDEAREAEPAFADLDVAEQFEMATMGSEDLQGLAADLDLEAEQTFNPNTYTQSQSVSSPAGGSVLSTADNLPPASVTLDRAGRVRRAADPAAPAPTPANPSDVAFGMDGTRRQPAGSDQRGVLLQASMDANLRSERVLTKVYNMYNPTQADELPSTPEQVAAEVRGNEDFFRLPEAYKKRILAVIAQPDAVTSLLDDTVAKQKSLRKELAGASASPARTADDLDGAPADDLASAPDDVTDIPAMRDEATADLEEADANAQFYQEQKQNAGVAQPISLRRVQDIVRRALGIQRGERMPLAFRSYDSRFGRRVSRADIEALNNRRTSIAKYDSMSDEEYQRLRARNTDLPPTRQEHIATLGNEFKRLARLISSDTLQDADPSGTNQARLVQQLFAADPKVRASALRELFAVKGLRGPDGLIVGDDGMAVLEMLARDPAYGSVENVLYDVLSRDPALNNPEAAAGRIVDESGAEVSGGALGPESLRAAAQTLASDVQTMGGRRLSSEELTETGVPAYLPDGWGEPTVETPPPPTRPSFIDRLRNYIPFMRRQADDQTAGPQVVTQRGLDSAAEEIAAATTPEEMNAALARINATAERTLALLDDTNDPPVAGVSRRGNADGILSTPISSSSSARQQILDRVESLRATWRRRMDQIQRSGGPVSPSAATDKTLEIEATNAFSEAYVAASQAGAGTAEAVRAGKEARDAVLKSGVQPISAADADAAALPGAETAAPAVLGRAAATANVSRGSATRGRGGSSASVSPARGSMNPAGYTIVFSDPDAVSSLRMRERESLLMALDSRISAAEADAAAGRPTAAGSEQMPPDGLASLRQQRSAIAVPAVSMLEDGRVSVRLTPDSEPIIGDLLRPVETDFGPVPPAFSGDLVGLDFGADGTPALRKKGNVTDRRGQDVQFEPVPVIGAASGASVVATPRLELPPGYRWSESGVAAPAAAGAVAPEVPPTKDIMDDFSRPVGDGLEESIPYDGDELDVNADEERIGTAIEESLLRPTPGPGRAAAERELEAEQAGKGGKKTKGSKSRKDGVTAGRAVAGAGLTALGGLGGTAIGPGVMNALVGAGTLGGLGFAPGGRAYGETPPDGASGDINTSAEPAGSQVRQARRRLSYLTSQNPLPY
jgi:hypothetical protein